MHRLLRCFFFFFFHYHLPDSKGYRRYIRFEGWSIGASHLHTGRYITEHHGFVAGDDEAEVCSRLS